MNRYLFVVMFGAFLLSACTQEATLQDLDSASFKKAISRRNGTLLDVRTPGEFANGHIKGAGQLNFYDRDFSEKLLMLEKDQEIYLYCNTGYRSKKAAAVLNINGYKKVYNLQRGIMDWYRNNNPIVTNPNAKPDTENRMESDEYLALIQSDTPVLIDFYAPWCAPCRKMLPMIDELSNTYKSKVQIVKINSDASKKLVKDQQISSVPYLVIYKNGKQLFEHEGFIERNDLISELNKL